MTKNREDYIKTIFQFEENNIEVTNKLLADTLGVAPASVSQMLNKLVESEMISNIDTSIKLTDKAILIAKDLVSKHRLWEAFLLEFLEYSWDSVHDDAEVLEHVTSQLLMEKLNKFLNYPTNCPHGGRIYVNENKDSEKLLPLNKLLINEEGIIKRFTDDKNLLAFVFENDININDNIKLISIDKYNSIYYFKSNDKDITLNKEVSSEIFVKII